MRPRLPAVLAVFFAVSLSAASTHADQIALSGRSPGRPDAVRAVFSSDVPEIRARVSFSASHKVGIEFNWIDPSGKPRLRSLKTAFPARGASTVEDIDILEVAGHPASEMPGWWTVETVAEGKKLSARFLLTRSREVLSLAYGEKKDKMAALTAAGKANPDLREILGIAMGDPDEEVRAASLVSLGGVTAGWALEILHSGQEDASPVVRLAALRSLLGAGGKEGAQAAVRAASDPSPDVRKAVAEGALPAEEAAAAELLGALIKDPDRGVRTASLSTLSRHEGKAYVDALAQGLKVDDPALWKAVVDVAASRGGAGPIPVLTAALLVSDPEIRIRAMKALAGRGWSGTKEALRPLLDDPDANVAEEALGALAALDDLPGLELAVRSRHLSVRKKAVSLLAGIKGGAGATGLAVAVKDEDHGIRADAVAWFIRQGGPGLPGILEKVACDQDPDIRAMGLGTLATLPGEASSKALRAYMACGDAGVRQAVTDILAGRDDKEAREAVKSALSDMDPRVRLNSATRLAQSGSGRSLAVIASDPDPAVRKMALLSIKKTAGPGMLPVLGEGLKDPDEGVRLAALGVLGEIPGEQSGLYISGALKDGSAEVQRLAVTLIMKRRDEGSLEGLSTLAVSGTPEGRKNALAAIGEIPGARADETLLRMYPGLGPDDKAYILKALASRKSGLLDEALRQAMGDKDLKVRATALDLAKNLPEGPASDLYRATLASGYPEVREAGLERLKGKKDEESRAALLKVLEDPEPYLRKRALAYLLSIGEPRVNGRLPGLVLDSDPGVRLTAFNAALVLKDKAAKADALLAAARGPYPDLARAALDGLLALDDARALPLYTKAFDEGYRRHDFVRGMGRIKEEAAVDALYSAYRGSADDDGLRVIAVESLAGRGARALQALSAAMTDPSDRVRIAALKAVKGIDGMEALKVMLPALEDPALKEDALAATAGTRRGPEEMEQVARFAAGLKDTALRARAFDLLDRNGLSAQFVAIFAHDDDPAIRARAFRVLAARTGPEPVFSLILIGAGEVGRGREPVEKALMDKKPEDLKGGVDMLFESGRAGDAELAFLTRISRDPDVLAYVVRRVPAGRDGLLRAALGPVVSRRAPWDVPAIMEGLKAARVEEDRRALARALAVVDNPDAGVYIAEAYKKYPDIRGELIMSTVGSGRSGNVMALALKDEDAANRRLAAGFLKGPKGGEFLASAIKDPDEAVRAAAVLAASEPANEAVLALAATDPAKSIRKAAAKGLGGMGGDKAVALLASLAADAEPGVSDEALASLQRLGDAVPSSLWAGLALDAAGRKAVRLAAVSAIVGRKESGSAAVLAKMLADPEAEVAGAATDGLRSLGKDSLPALYPLLKDPAKRPAALDLLGEFKDPSSEPLILAEMPGMDEASRVKAVNALGMLGGKDSLGMLADCYKDGPGSLKLAVVKALGTMNPGGGPEVTLILSDALENDSPAIRFQAAHAAAAIRPGGLKPSLEKRLAAEKSALVKDEIKKALDALSATPTP